MLYQFVVLFMVECGERVLTCDSLERTVDKRVSQFPLTIRAFA
jgi:hypothetical protein